MCGINGIWDIAAGTSAQCLESIAEHMAAAQAHRGPDMAAVWSDAAAGIVLGHRRLSIIDLSDSGRQPMISHSGRYVIVFNGEIYNFGDLRRDLEARGAHFMGTSDTEVLLAAIEQFGLETALESISGMFAFALWDRRDRTLSLARDRIGKKPLYYGWFNGRFHFASELKAIVKAPGFERSVDRVALSDYLERGYVASPRSIWHGIAKLPAGTLLSISAGKRDGEPRPFWSFDAVAHQDKDPALSGEALVDVLEAEIRTAVRNRMVADVPVGAFLSGGIDSSIIVALMQQEASQPVRTFTIGFTDAHFDEASEARRVAERVGSIHCSMDLSPRAARAIIPDLPDIYDEPFADPSAIPMAHVAALAREQVTVALSGDGGDELFGGYGRYRLALALGQRLGALPEWFRKLIAGTSQAMPLPLVDALARRLPNAIQTGLRGDVSGDRLLKLAALIGARDGDALYRRLTSICADPARFVTGGDGGGVQNHAGPADRLHRMMYADSIAYLPDDILVKVDRATMAVGLEARAPLLDRAVIELAWRIDPAELMRNGQGKWPLRRLYDRLLPGLASDRPKQGFSVPIAQWLRGPLRDWAEDLLAAAAIARTGLLEPDPIRTMWREHLSGQRNWSAQLWALLMFRSWEDRWCATASQGFQSQVAEREAA